MGTQQDAILYETSSVVRSYIVDLQRVLTEDWKQIR